VTILSAQSGDWTNPATWVGGIVPDLTADDVVIGHSVAIPSGSALSLAGGRSLEVQSGAQLSIGDNFMHEAGSWINLAGSLSIQSGVMLDGYGELTVSSGGWLDCHGTLFFEAGNSPVLGGDLQVFSGGTIYLLASTSLSINGSLTIESGGYVGVDSSSLYLSGSVTIRGYLGVDYYSAAYVLDLLSVEPGGSLNAGNGGRVQVESGGRLAISGQVEVYDNAALYLSAGTQMLLQRDGVVNVYLYGELTIEGLAEIFGSFSLDTYTFLNVTGGGRMRVYRTIQLSGQMQGGGRIEILRREAAIHDSQGNSLIFFDRAYGFGQALIA
jgi:hypothetical protein